MAGFDYVKIGGIGTQLTRDWGRRDVGLITNSGFATNGLPNFIISPNVHSAITTPGGLIVSGPLRGSRSARTGATSNYDFGQVFGSTMIGGDGANQNENLLALLGTPTEDFNALASAKYDVSDKVQLFAEVSGGKSERRRREPGIARPRQPRDPARQRVPAAVGAQPDDRRTTSRRSPSAGSATTPARSSSIATITSTRRSPARRAHFGGWTADGICAVRAQRLRPGVRAQQPQAERISERRRCGGRPRDRAASSAARR